MAKVSKVRRKSASRRYKVAPISAPSTHNKAKNKDYIKKFKNKLSSKNDWEDSTCSVCMEFPHNAVLLLCSSYNKGCRPYMCATSYRYSNCLDLYKKAYTKVMDLESNEKKEITELLCPLCRGQVKGWTVVDPAREYLNLKKRTCMQENCSFLGNYKHLKKHVKEDHPLARPREVDPTTEANWARLEHERERSDVMSTIRSSMPGAIVLGDYVIEGNYRGLYRNFEDVDNVFIPLDSFATGGFQPFDDDESSELFRLASENSNRRRLIFGRSRRRRRHRLASGDR